MGVLYMQRSDYIVPCQVGYDAGTLHRFHMTIRDTLRILVEHDVALVFYKRAPCEASPQGTHGTGAVVIVGISQERLQDLCSRSQIICRHVSIEHRQIQRAN